MWTVSNCWWNVPELIIGCPILRREWIAREWVDFAVRSARNAGLEPTFLVVAGEDIGHVPGALDPTIPVLERALGAHGLALNIEPVPEPRCQDQRMWGLAGGYERMVDLRNTLLRRIREIGPDLFLSLDSDILLHPGALTSMRQTMLDRGWDAIGGKCYMTPQHTGRRNPSWAKLNPQGGLYRTDSDGQIPVQIIMAIKLMTPAAYAVDYRVHAQGEDIGWSLNAKEQHVQLGWDGSVCSKHVMQPSELSEPDERCGY